MVYPAPTPSPFPWAAVADIAGQGIGGLFGQSASKKRARAQNKYENAIGQELIRQESVFRRKAALGRIGLKETLANRGLTGSSIERDDLANYDQDVADRIAQIQAGHKTKDIQGALRGIDEWENKWRGGIQGAGLGIENLPRMLGIKEPGVTSYGLSGLVGGLLGAYNPSGVGGFGTINYRGY